VGILDKGTHLAEMMAKGLMIVFLALFLAGCGSINNLNKTAGTAEPTGVFNDPDSLPTDDSPYARSPRRQVGHGFSFKIFRRDKEDGDSPSQLAIDDPEYAEYLEWKRWQEFKAYQEWKAQQAGANSAS
jgi:hypothetical protein|tara:strand:+ start:1122 stop:1508 length:387 start_codon:yes stop_codon:yes gene_type:complete